YSSELQGHLRTRLRQAALIFGGAAVVVLFFNLVTRPPAFAADPLSRVLHVAAVVVPLLVAGVVSGPWLLSLRTLRWIELALFPPRVLFFSWMHFRTYKTTADLLVPGSPDVQLTISLASATNSLRWVCLLVIYGTLTPNTSRRCVIAVLALASLPVLL